MAGLPQSIARHLAGAQRVFLSAGSAEPPGLHAALAEVPEAARGVNFTGSFVPGVNERDYAALHPSARMTTLLLPGAARTSLEAGKIDILPLSYTGFAAHLERMPCDTVIAQVTPPDTRGRATLGPAADFVPLQWHSATRRIAIINPALPRPPGAHVIDLSLADALIEDEARPIELLPAARTPVNLAIAQHVAVLVPDGAVVQVGLGGAPGVTLEALTGHRNITIHSGMISDEVVDLAAAGALAPDGHRTGIAIGSARLYDWLPEARGFAFVPTPLTHSAAALAARSGLLAINSALEVDLFGQVNLEWRGNRLVSGVGGAPDFNAGARLSPGGLAIVALPATARGTSRVVSRLAAPTVSIPRTMIDVVVTEHGTAHIRDLPVEARAQALIGIAAPEHRDRLQAEWERMRDAG